MVNLATVIKRTQISQCTGRASGNRLHSLVSSARCTWKPPSASNSAPSGTLCPEKKHPEAQISIHDPNISTARSCLLLPSTRLFLFSWHLQRNSRWLTRFTLDDKKILHTSGNEPNASQQHIAPHCHCIEQEQRWSTQLRLPLASQICLRNSSNPAFFNYLRATVGTTTLFFCDERQVGLASRDLWSSL